MRVVCHLREIRGDRSLTEIMDELPQKSGLSRGLLSQLEQGRFFPRDDQRLMLEAAYGARVDSWYEPSLLVELQHDPSPQHEAEVAHG